MPGPPGNAACVPIPVNWAQSGPSVQLLTTLQQYFSGRFNTLQSVYIDNSTCPSAIGLTSSDTGQRIIVKPFSGGWYPLFCGPSPQLTATNYQLLTYANAINPLQVLSGGSTTFTLLNVPARPFEFTSDGTILPPNTVVFSAKNILIGELLMPAPPPQPTTSAELYTVIYGMNLILSGGPYASAKMVQLALTAFNSGTYDEIYFLDGFESNTTGGVFYSKNLAFDPPLIAIQNAEGLYLTLDNYPVTGGIQIEGSLIVSTILVE